MSPILIGALVGYAIGGVILGVLMWRDIYATGMPESSFQGAKMKHAGNKRYATLWAVFFALIWIGVLVTAALAWSFGVAHNWVIDGDKH